MQDESGPLPSIMGLNAIPKFMFNLVVNVKKARNTLLRDGDRCTSCPPLINYDNPLCAK